MNIDISIVLNLHNEVSFLRRTFESLAQAARYAKFHGLTIELVVVLDNAEKNTKEWAFNYHYRDYDNYKIIEVSNGSLGLSRNDGIKVASGEYITTADGDDLISYNILKASYDVVLREGGKIIVCPEYVYSFGNNHYLQIYTGSQEALNILLFGGNNYVSRIFCHRSVFEDIQYIDARGELKAFEDWHFNCEAVSHGFEFRIAPDTMLFYRQRQNSIMTTAKNKIIPFSNYFQPNVFVSLCAENYKEVNGRKWLDVKPVALLRNKVLSSYKLLELISAANNIDPSIDFEQLKSTAIGHNRAGPAAAGCAYFEIAQKVENHTFTDVVLMPFIARGGAEKYIFNLVKSLRYIDNNRRILVLSGQNFPSHEKRLLPDNAVFIDLYEICKRWEINDINLVTLRLIQAVASTALLHIKPCDYAFNFYSKFGLELDNPVVFYYFLEGVADNKGIQLKQGANFNFLSENLNKINYVISDHEKAISYLQQRIDFFKTRLFSLYAQCDLILNSEKLSFFYPKKKLLWAARLDWEKRPEILSLIAHKVFEYDPEIKIDVWGTSAYSHNNFDAIARQPNIIYKGGFSSFTDIPLEEYDALIYTSKTDGLPNIILEILSVGLLVIAPDVGGISEIIKNNETGILLENEVDDIKMANQYMQAIKSVYESEVQVDKLRKNALELIGERHSEKEYLKNVKSIFFKE